MQRIYELIVRMDESFTRFIDASTAMSIVATPPIKSLRS